MRIHDELACSLQRNRVSRRQVLSEAFLAEHADEFKDGPADDADG